MTATPAAPALACHACGSRYALAAMFHGCPACRSTAGAKPLEVVYDYDALRSAKLCESWTTRPDSMWSYRELLPLPPGVEPVSMAEGATPLIELPTNGLGKILVKDETRNPTGAHKDRFHSVSISMARHLGVRGVTAATTGNHGLSAAAYAARAGLSALIFCDPRSPSVLRDMINFFGGRVVVMKDRTALLTRLVSDCGWYPSTTLSPAPVGTPYGVEGYKTIAFELYRQLEGRLPNYVVTPVAGGDLIYGTWLGFRDLVRIANSPFAHVPRMIAAQSTECDPVVRGFRARAQAVPHVQPNTIALSIGDETSTAVALSAIYESGGTAEAVPDADIVAAVRLLARSGLASEPSGAASVAVALAQQRQGVFTERDVVVCVMTGAAVKWPDTISLGVERHIVEDSEEDAVRTWVEAFDRTIPPQRTTGRGE